MIAQLMKALSKFLRGQFPNYPVYRQYPEEGFEMPCFVVRSTGGNLRRRIRQDKSRRGISFERFTIEFYSLDITEIVSMGYDLRILLDTIEVDNGDLYRCYNKNAMVALTENHVSLTFNIRTTPYIESEPLPKIETIDFKEELLHD